MNTLQDYYTSIGKPLPSVSERAKIAEQMFGMTNYVGSEQQNGLLLQNLIKPNPVKPAQATTQPSLYSGVFKLPNPNTPTTRVADFVQPVINKANEIFGRYNATPTANSTLSNLFTPNNNVFNQLQTNQNVSGINPTGAIAQSIQAGQNGNSNPAIRDGKLVTQPAPTPQISTGQVNTNNNANQTQNFNNQYSNVGNTASTSSQNNQTGTNISNTATSTTNTVQQPISLSQSLSNLTFDNYTHPSAQTTEIQTQQNEFYNQYASTLNEAKVGVETNLHSYIDILAQETAKSEREASQLNLSNEGLLNRIAQASGTSRYTPAQSYGAITQERTRFQNQISDIRLKEKKAVLDAQNSTLKDKVKYAQDLYNLGNNKIEFTQQMKQKELDYQQDLKNWQKEQVTPYINSISQSLKGKDINSQKTIIEGFAKNLGVSPDFIKAQVVNNEAQRTSAYSGLIQKYLQDYPDANIPAEALYSNDITAVMNAIRSSSQIYKNSIQGDQLKLATEREKLAPGSYASSELIKTTTASPTDTRQIQLIRQALTTLESQGSKDRNGNAPGSANYDQYQVVGIPLPSNSSNAGFRAQGKYQIMPNLHFKKLGGEYAKYNSKNPNDPINKELEDKFLRDRDSQDALANVIIAENLKASGGNVAQAMSRYLGTGAVDLATGKTNSSYTREAFAEYTRLAGLGGTSSTANNEVISYANAVARGELNRNNVPEKLRGEVLQYLDNNPQLKSTKTRDISSYNEGQLKSADFANRMTSSNSILDNLENSVKFNRADILSGINSSMPNFLRSSNSQSYENAAREFIAGILRKDTGAAVTDSEFDQYYQIYFPKAGDSDDVVNQKAAARSRAIDGVKTTSGGAYDALFGGITDVQPGTEKKDVTPTNGTSGQTKSGIKFTITKE